MPAHSTPRVTDGTTGGSAHGGRRTHIIQLLRDTKEPLSVERVAEMVGVHANTARFHLESLVDAGLASRETEVTARRGRRHILYTGVLPNQTHERAQGYRLLAQIMSGMIAARCPDSGDDMYEAGLRWGGRLTNRPAPGQALDEAEIDRRILDKGDALWFAPELQQTPRRHLLFHNCPIVDAVGGRPGLVCHLHAGMMNGALSEMRSSQRVARLEPMSKPHLCRAWLEPADSLDDGKVRIQLPDEAEAGGSSQP